MTSIETSIQDKVVAFHTLGCRLNFSETGTIARGFMERGYAVVPFGEPADVVFINTCTVTDGADSTCRNLIRKAHRSSPEAKIVVAGCYAQMEAEAISQMQGVDLILGTSEKYKVFDYLGEEERQLVKIDKSQDFWGAATSFGEGHTRAFLKIQDGCNYICSFCIIPQARGRSRAISIDQAVANAKTLAAEGFKEVVLTGVNIGEYEATSGEKLTDLLEALFAVEGIERWRLSSVEPNTITDELLGLLKASPKFLNHFHIPMQSGCDEVLTSMRRKYTVQEYRAVIEKIISNFPEAGIGADMIVGHPGETPEQFQETYALAKELPLTHFHLFPFSKRKGTTAANMQNYVHSAAKKERLKALELLGQAKLDLFSSDQVGETSEVLFEKRDKSGECFEGYTSNFVRVFVKTDSDLKNQVRKVHLTEFLNGRLMGEILH
ncbi:MAG: tRNA (N(6)-L-threonylcarbamoyladenosine(37)-C(2))-methylthiotransferase MtaB [Halobacteriovoraceae bacterium]|nr:tRNA (N(6)-L-threonylcarbamoyladenosine(37)-C(2))-methylthiotransferase MtaB [Halobacteriovoraceae bacterium]